MAPQRCLHPNRQTCEYGIKIVISLLGDGRVSWIMQVSERGKQERQNQSRGSMRRTQPNVAGLKTEGWGRGPRAVDGF